MSGDFQNRWQPLVCKLNRHSIGYQATCPYDGSPGVWICRYDTEHVGQEVCNCALNFPTATPVPPCPRCNRSTGVAHYWDSATGRCRVEHGGWLRFSAAWAGTFVLIAMFVVATSFPNSAGGAARMRWISHHWPSLFGIPTAAAVVVVLLLGLRGLRRAGRLQRVWPPGE